MQLKGTKTLENLKAAFAGESQANRRYLYFANKADVEGQNDVAALFRSTAEARRDMRTGTWTTSGWSVIPQQIFRSDSSRQNLKAAVAGGNARIYRHVSRVWPRLRARRALPKSRTGSKRLPRPNVRTPTASRSALDQLAD